MAKSAVANRRMNVILKSVPENKDFRQNETFIIFIGGTPR